MPAVGGHHVDGVVLGRRDDAAVGDERLAVQLPVEDRRGPGPPRRQQLGVRRVDSGRLSIPVVGGPVGAEAGGRRHGPRPRRPGGRGAEAAERRGHQGRPHSEGCPQVPPGSMPHTAASRALRSHHGTRIPATVKSSVPGLAPTLDVGDDASWGVCLDPLDRSEFWPEPHYSEADPFGSSSDLK